MQLMSLPASGLASNVLRSCMRVREDNAKLQSACNARKKLIMKELSSLSAALMDLRELTAANKAIIAQNQAMARKLRLVQDACKLQAEEKRRLESEKDRLQSTSERIHRSLEAVQAKKAEMESKNRSIASDATMLSEYNKALQRDLDASRANALEKALPKSPSKKIGPKSPHSASTISLPCPDAMAKDSSTEYSPGSVRSVVPPVGWTYEPGEHPARQERKRRRGDFKLSLAVVPSPAVSQSDRVKAPYSVLPPPSPRLQKSQVERMRMRPTPLHRKRAKSRETPAQRGPSHDRKGKSRSLTPEMDLFDEG